MSDSTSRLPNLYQLLGLAPLESDRARIAAAVKRLQKPNGNDVAVGSNELQRAEKIVALAEKYLLDPQRKAAYDQQWKAVYQANSPNAAQTAAPANVASAKVASPKVAPAKSAPAKSAPAKSAPAKSAPAKSAPAKSVSENAASAKLAQVQAARVHAPSGKTSTSNAVSSAHTTAATAASTAPVVAAPAPAWDYSRLEQLLPQGDPAAAFDMASFLRTSGESRDPMAAEADLAKLTALLADPAANAGAASSPVATLAEPMVVGSDGHAGAGESLGFSPSVRGGPPTPSSSNLARRMRQRKQRALLVGGSILAAGLGGLALLGFYLFSPKPDPTPVSLANAGGNRPAPVRGSGLPQIDLAAAPPTAETPAANAPPVGSGLPQPGEGPMDLEIGTAPPNGQPPESKPESMPESSSTPNANPDVPAPPASTEPEPKPQPEPLGGNEPTPPGEPQPEPKPEPAPAMIADAELTKEEKRAWQKGMTEAKGLIGDHKFEEVEKLLTELEATAKTGRQRGQLERLEQVLGFVKDIRQAMEDAISGLGPADTFKAGTSTVASFVEGDDRRIAVRVSGRNISAPLENLPVGLALGLVDLKLDVEHASTLARKGAYILTHPNGKAAHERGKQMLQAAADAGAITPELAKFYEDDYSLSDK